MHSAPCALTESRRPPTYVAQTVTACLARRAETFAVGTPFVSRGLLKWTPTTSGVCQSRRLTTAHRQRAHAHNSPVSDEPIVWTQITWYRRNRRRRSNHLWGMPQRQLVPPSPTLLQTPSQLAMRTRIYKTCSEDQAGFILPKNRYPTPTLLPLAQALLSRQTDHRQNAKLSRPSNSLEKVVEVEG